MITLVSRKFLVCLYFCNTVYIPKSTMFGLTMIGKSVLSMTFLAHGWISYFVHMIYEALRQKLPYVFHFEQVNKVWILGAKVDLNKSLFYICWLWIYFFVSSYHSRMSLKMIFWLIRSAYLQLKPLGG